MRKVLVLDVTAWLTSRRRSPLIMSLAMDHGIGRVVVTFSALRIPSTSVKRNSTPAWMPTLKKILKRLRLRIMYNFGRPSPLLVPWTPPLRVGNAGGPCLFIPTARLGIIVSNMRKSKDGARKNTARMPSVPKISTLRGVCERTRVLHVWENVSSKLRYFRYFNETHHVEEEEVEWCRVRSQGGHQQVSKDWQGEQCVHVEWNDFMTEVSREIIRIRIMIMINLRTECNWGLGLYGILHELVDWSASPMT